MSTPTNTEYQKGFCDGFAAAVRQSRGIDGPSIAMGYETSEATRRVAVGFPVEMFEQIRANAVANNRSFSAEVRVRLSEKRP